MLEVVLEEPDRVYFAGDEVRGQVFINIKAPLSVQCESIKCITQTRKPTSILPESTRKA
jgi:hypothetical protein